MADRPRYVTVSFLILSMLTVSFYMVIFYDTTKAQIGIAPIDPRTLEEVMNQVGRLNDTAQIDVGDSPQYIYGNLGVSDLLYVANYDSDTISVIDTNTYKVTHIDVGNAPEHIYGDLEVSEKLYVANYGSVDSLDPVNDTISVIDTKKEMVIKKIPVGNEPSYIFGDLRKSPDLYVANSGSNFVSVIDTRTNNVTENIPVGIGPRFIYGDLKESPDIYVANFGSNFVSVIDTRTNNVTENITVGDYPMYIYGDPGSGIIYVANLGGGLIGTSYGNVSVINTKTYDVIESITVGKSPEYIYGDLRFLYVTNSDSNTVSVIDTSTNNVTENITVGNHPTYIYGNLVWPDIYVANSDSNTVSVIDTSTNHVTENITVGDYPMYIYGDLEGPPELYVASGGSNGVNVINFVKNQVVAGATFDVIPFGAGDIFCDTASKGLPMNYFLFVPSGTKCIAKPNNGFEFGSWVEVLDGNSSRTISASSGSAWRSFLDFFNIKFDDPASASPFTSFLNFTYDFLKVESNDPGATLTVNRFGNFTAYFRALPPPFPAEYLATLFSVSVTAVIGAWLLPTGIGWFKSRKQTNSLNSYHQKITSAYPDIKFDKNGNAQPRTLIDNIMNAYTEGKISNEQYANLKNEISVLEHDTFKKKIDLLDGPHNGDVRDIESISEDIKKSYSNGSINSEHFADLKDRVSVKYDEILSEEMNRIKEISVEDPNRQVRLNEVQGKIKDVYSKGKITELHYNLLNERLSKLTSNDHTHHSK